MKSVCPRPGSVGRGKRPGRAGCTELALSISNNSEAPPRAGSVRSDLPKTIFGEVKEMGELADDRLEAYPTFA
ncbi:hypothetical protein GCM10023156_63850 [Novipirellula rosea]|uniref:Uncharacterized protein n=1 Tax=Novipirellula rosea TaxID=1031540 RepID=A0ABP8NTA3_9BACT